MMSELRILTDISPTRPLDYQQRGIVGDIFGNTIPSISGKKPGMNMTFFVAQEGNIRNAAGHETLAAAKRHQIEPHKQASDGLEVDWVAA